jgi:hypothetical protein
VRVITLDSEVERTGLRRPTGTVQLAQVSTLNLLETFDRLIAWMQPGGNDGPKPADCPAKIAATYLARIGDWKLPVLLGVIEAAVMRPDGTILSTRGYDEATELYLHSEEDWPALPDAPRRAEAEAAVRELREPFAEFPFVDEAARSVLIAGILTAIQRRLLESAPLFAFDAPAQRSGKSLLAESLGLIATGRKPAATGVAKEGDELRKAITSALRENQAIINLDNLTHPLDSPDLARALTQSEYADRLLGASRMLRLPTNVLWTATGNNLMFRGDIPSRALISRIDPGEERPEERVFKIDDLPAHLLVNWKAIIALLTLCLSFVILSATGRSSRVWASDRISGGFGRSQLAPFQLSALHRPIMRMRFFVVVRTRAAEKEKDRLTVFSHMVSPYFEPITTYTASGLFEIVSEIIPVLTMNLSASKALARASAGINKRARPSLRNPIMIPDMNHSRAFKFPILLNSPVFLSCSAGSHLHPALTKTEFTIPMNVIASGVGSTANTNGVGPNFVNLSLMRRRCSGVRVLGALYFSRASEAAAASRSAFAARSFAFAASLRASPASLFNQAICLPDCSRIWRSISSAYPLYLISIKTPISTMMPARSSHAHLRFQCSEIRAITATSAISPPISASFPTSRQFLYPDNSFSNVSGVIKWLADALVRLIAIAFVALLLWRRGRRI